jgi:hypothetical protein
MHKQTRIGSALVHLEGWEAGRLEGKGREGKGRKDEAPELRLLLRLLVAAKRRGSRTEGDFQLEISFCDRHPLRPLPVRTSKRGRRRRREVREC